MVAWRLDAARHAPTWDSGIGAELEGGRWNPRRVRTVYASLDPATTILESAVHRGFDVLDAQPHVLTSFEILDAADVAVVAPEAIANPVWLHAGIPSAAQQRFGAERMAAHRFVVLPSVVSRWSWNVVFHPERATGRYRLLVQRPLGLDTRLNPPPATR